MLTILFALAQVASEPVFQAKPCPDGIPSQATCGIVTVPEDRSRPDGRTIELSLVVLKSATPARLPPLFDFEGGPGLPTWKNAGFYAGNGVSKDRDVVMIDQRGTGRSNGLMCPSLSSVPPTEPMLPPAEVAACLQSLQARADLRHYGTADAVADVETVRRALNYGKIDLFGLSYGTTVALAYMREYPANVRAAMLWGAAPPQAMPPRAHATAATQALDRFIADCAAKPACAQRFPTLRQDIAKARALSSAPELLMERIRTKLYTPATRAGLPLAIEAAAKGNPARLFDVPQGGPPPIFADGMFLAITCGESFPLMDYGAAASAAQVTPFGDYRLRTQRSACTTWPKVRLSPDHLDLPAKTDASVLFISGGMDPVTPPEWADEITRAMRRARNIVIPASGHLPDGLANLDCLDGLSVAFLDHGELTKIDSSCVASMTSPDYAPK